MELTELISDARDVISARRVYGDPYEKNGLTVIPAATVRGGGGGGMGDHEGGEAGTGGGFGLMARPSGAWIVEDGHATWKPAIDVNRIVLGGQTIALTAILAVSRVRLAQARRRRSLLGLIPHRPEHRRARRHLAKRARRQLTALNALSHRRPNHHRTRFGV
jgi:hypothetical protein